MFVMKILLVSDSHVDESTLKQLVEKYPNMDCYLHAGDSGLDRDTLYPFESVKGNTDYYPFDDLLRIYTPMGYLLIKHKPWFTAEQVRDNKFLVHGHTHQYRFYLEGEKIFLNPGSLTLPRDGTNGTYMILDIKSSSCSIKVYDIETKTILINEEIV